MTSFVQPDFPLVHAGATRVTWLLDQVRHGLSRLGRPDAMASMLVAAGLAAVIVVAEQIVSSWADGHLLAAWIALWLIVFVLLAAFSDALRAWPLRWQARVQARRQAAAQRAQDRATWAAALADPRLMAELDLSLLRAQQQAEDSGQPVPQWAVSGIGGRRSGSRPWWL